MTTALHVPYNNRVSIPFPSLALLPPLLAGLLLWSGAQRALWRPLVTRSGFKSPGLMAALFASALFIFTPTMISSLVPIKGHPTFGLAMASHVSNLMLLPLGWGLWRLYQLPFPWGRCSILRGLGVSVMAMVTLFPLVYLAAELNREWALALKLSTPHPLLAYLKDPSTGSAHFMAVALGACWVVPAAEELLFRGLWQGSVEQHLGTAASIFLPSVFFALAHPAETYLPMFVLALCLGLVTRVSGSLLPGIFLHMMFNSLSVADVALERFGFPWQV